MFIEISEGIWLNKDEIVAVTERGTKGELGVSSYYENKIVNVCGKLRRESYILLKNETLISSPYSAEKILKS